MSPRHPALHGRQGVAVFGSSEPAAGNPLYEAARDAGQRLAKAGMAIINGGYGGVMEAASRGARDAGGLAIGVTVEQFAGRGEGNAWLSHEIRELDMFQRTRTLVDLADGFLVLAGKAGTLAELSFLWALRRAGLLGERPVVLAAPSWNTLMEMGHQDGFLDAATLRQCWGAATIPAAVDLLLENMS